MEDLLAKGFADNLLTFRGELNRIANKYSKLEGGMDVDMFDVSPRSLRSYMDESKVKVDEMEPRVHLQRLEDTREWKEESFRSQDVTKTSQLDFTDSGDGAYETGSTLSQASGSDDDDEKMQSDTNGCSLGSFYDTDTELQPESQDEELDMTLRSNGSSIANLYSGMVCRIERAWQRHSTSAAANSVVRRYRRWRQPQRGGALDASLAVRHGKRKPGKMKSSCSPEGKQFVAAPSSARSPFQHRTHLQQRHPSPAPDMEITGPVKAFKPRGATVNQTFTSPKSHQQPAKPRTNIGSPSRPYHLTQTSSWEPSLRTNRPPLPAEPAPGFPRSAERSNSYSSPIRESPVKARRTDSPARPPLVACPRTPQGRSPERYSRKPMRRRCLSASSVSPQKSRMLYQQDFHPSPQLARADLSSSDSAPPPPVSTPLSPQKLDEEILKMYHKFVCMNKSPRFNSHPCRICVKYPEVRKWVFSSSVAALALSPHRSTLRKRGRDSDHQPQSPCSSDQCCLPSPGSKRHRNEMLKRHLSRSEVSTQLDSTDLREETRFRLSQLGSPRRAGHSKARCKLALPTGNGEHGSYQRSRPFTK